MMYSDQDLKRELGSSFDITPRPRAAAIQPASIDLTLGREFMRYALNIKTVRFRPDGTKTAGGAGFGEFSMDEVERTEEFAIAPGEFALATTVERVKIGSTVAARVEGKSTLGRLGLLVHATAGFIDPGFEGKITLELCNLSPATIVLAGGMDVCQLALYPLLTECAEPYGKGRGSHYQGQDGVTGAR